MHRQRFPDKRVAYFAVGRCRIAAQQSLRRHDHSRRAEAALRAELFVKGALQPVEPALRRQAFDRFDAAAFAAHRERDAGWHRFAVDQNRTCAALAAVAAGLHAGKVRDIAQIVDKQRAFGDCVFTPPPVEPQSQQTFFSCGPGACI